MDDRQVLVEAHGAVFGSRSEEARLVFAPYRVCPLGAHVDHQLGLVTGFALNAGIRLAFTRNSEGWVRLRSLNFDGEVKFHLSHIAPSIPGDWGNYARGAALALQEEHSLRYGLDGVVAGSLPIGGLSSSAAVGVAYLLALEYVNDLHLNAWQNICLDQFIENQYIGLNNGILDQSVILLSKRRHLLFLDCQTGEHEPIPSPQVEPCFAIAIVYSGLSRPLVNTGYNQRVAECCEAAKQLLVRAGHSVPGDPVLRHVPEEVFREYADTLPPPLQRRARHFFTEMDRARRGLEAWRAGDLQQFGELVSESGESSIRNYECGAEHLTTLYHLLREAPGVYGARFCGAGFRGCCMALVEPAAISDLEPYIRGRYLREYPDVANQFSMHFCQSDEGARLS